MKPLRKYKIQKIKTILTLHLENIHFMKNNMTNLWKN